MPGVLCAGRVTKTYGNIDDNQWGIKYCRGVKYNGQVGKYKITHNIGHTSYYVNVTPVVNLDWNGLSALIVEKTANYIVIGIYIADQARTNVDNDFDFMICGKN